MTDLFFPLSNATCHSATTSSISSVPSISTTSTTTNHIPDSDSATSTASVAPVASSSNPSSPKKKEPHHWRPATPRLGALMAEAKHLAEARYIQLQAQKSVSKKPRRQTSKRTRPLTNREKSSLRSAVVCREKFDIYPKLLERELAAEEDTFCKLLGQSLHVNAAIVDLERQIAEAELRADAAHGAPASTACDQAAVVAAPQSVHNSLNVVQPGLDVTRLDEIGPVNDSMLFSIGDLDELWECREEGDDENGMCTPVSVMDTNLVAPPGLALPLGV